MPIIRRAHSFDLRLYSAGALYDSDEYSTYRTAILSQPGSVSVIYSISSGSQERYRSGWLEDHPSYASFANRFKEASSSPRYSITTHRTLSDHLAKVRLMGLTRLMACDNSCWHPKGINVNAIAPGYYGVNVKTHAHCARMFNRARHFGNESPRAVGGSRVTCQA